MIFIYDIGVWLYHGIVWCLRSFNAKAGSFARGRDNSFELLRRYAKQQNAITYWFHCASLGEFEQARPLMEHLKKQYPSIKIALSFFSPSGYEHQKDYAYAEIVFYLPRDSNRNARKVLELLNPAKVFFIKYEFWLHYIDTLHKAGTPVYLVSALFRNDQVFFKWYGAIFKKILKKYNRIFVQDEASENLLHQLGIKGLLTGDTRFDRVIENKNRAQEEPRIAAFKQDQKIIIVGSSWPQEEELLFKAYDASLKYKIILAPHELKRRITFPEDLKIAYLSTADPGTIGNADILVVDSIGKLNSIYRYADLAIVGGGFRGALHNILEAAVFGIPVIYGPQTQKHPEAEMLVEAGGGIIIRNTDELRAQINKLFTDTALWERKGAQASQFVNRHAGATLKIVNEIKK